MKTAEGALKDKVKLWLKSIGAWYNMPVPTGYGTPMLDFVGCWQGRFYMIETKAPGKLPTRRQLLTIDEVRAADGCAIWGDSLDVIQQQWCEFFECD